MSLTPNMFYLIPAKGRTVPDPVTGLALPDAGAFKPRNSYWRRRVADESVTVGEPPQAPAAKPKAASKTIAAADATKPKEGDA